MQIIKFQTAYCFYYSSYYALYYLSKVFTIVATQKI